MRPKLAQFKYFTANIPLIITAGLLFKFFLNGSHSAVFIYLRKLFDYGF